MPRATFKRIAPLSGAFLLAFPLLFLAACSGGVPRAAHAPAIETSADARPAPFMLSRVVARLPVGAELGVVGTGEYGLGCLWPWAVAGRDTLHGEIDRESAREAFNAAMEGLGYDVAGSGEHLFEEEETADMLRSEYRVAARIVEVRMEGCLRRPDPIYGGATGIGGEMFMAVEWSIFDTIARRTVYKARTQGYGRSDAPNREGISLLISAAFEMAAHNLGADKGFHDLIFYGEKPENWRKKKTLAEDRPRRFDPNERLVLPDLPLSREPFAPRAAEAARLAVLVQGGVGHGSGFFLTQEGHILTNFHVVGDAQRVRIVTAGKKKRLAAEVLRAARTRDVALLRLESVPEDLKIMILPLRTSRPEVGERVYAVGAPTFTRLQDTVTSGIVSAWRQKMFEERQSYIQADVEIHGGNSGGPLIDANGNILGISARGISESQSSLGSGLNFFIPIAEALAALDLDEPPVVKEDDLSDPEDLSRE